MDATAWRNFVTEARDCTPEMRACIALAEMSAREVIDALAGGVEWSEEQWDAWAELAAGTYEQLFESSQWFPLNVIESRISTNPITEDEALDVGGEAFLALVDAVALHEPARPPEVLALEILNTWLAQRHTEPRGPESAGKRPVFTVRVIELEPKADEPHFETVESSKVGHCRSCACPEKPGQWVQCSECLYCMGCCDCHAEEL